MDEENRINALDMVRRIRDAQTKELEGKTDTEIIEFFRKAGDAASRPMTSKVSPIERACEQRSDYG